MKPHKRKSIFLFAMASICQYYGFFSGEIKSGFLAVQINGVSKKDLQEVPFGGVKPSSPESPGDPNKIKVSLVPGENGQLRTCFPQYRSRAFAWSWLVLLE